MDNKIGLIGLGKMGSQLALNLIEKNWEVSAFNRSIEKANELKSKGVKAASSIKELIKMLKPPRILFLMLTAGEPTNNTIMTLSQLLSANDIVIDGGNSYFKDSEINGKILDKKKIQFFGAGISGGPSGARNGACCMVGGKKEVFPRVEKLFFDISIKNGYEFFEGFGAGHFVKMIHNGVEYGMMQAIAEGFEILKKSDYKFDLTKVAKIYQHGSVIESRLIGWLVEGFLKYGEDLSKISSTVAHSGEGEWTVKTAKEMKISVKIIEESLNFRLRSENNPSYAGKIVSLLRNMFGGHDVF